jgi:polar amino acid transport system permease protein
MHALHQVAHAFFNPHSFTLALPDVWAGFLVNLHMMVIAEVLVLVFALALAIVRGLPGPGAKPLRALAIAYTDFFRGTPIIIVAFFIGFGIPGLQLGYVSSRSVVTYGVITLTLVYTAYVTEVYRAGIESVHPSQRAAARSLGLSYAQSMRYVVVPQAVRRVIPPLLNDFIGLQKDTALVGFAGAIEAFNQSTIDVDASFNFTPYLAAALLFVAITIPLARFTDHLIARDRRRRQAQGLLT